MLGFRIGLLLYTSLGLKMWVESMCWCFVDDDDDGDDDYDDDE